MSRIRFPLSVVLSVFVILLATGGVAFGLDFSPLTIGENDVEPARNAEDVFRSSPLMFIENVGQWNPSPGSGQGPRFQVWGGPGNAMWLAEDAIWLTVLEPDLDKETRGQGDRESSPNDSLSPLHRVSPSPQRGVNIKLSFPGANPHPTIETFDRLDTKVSYFLGNDPDQWRPDVPVWGGVRYVDLWPGVDLVVGAGLAPAHGRPPGSPLPWRFVAKEGADVSAVQMRVEGAEGAKIDDGWLHLATEAQELVLPLPHAEFVYEVEALTKANQSIPLQALLVDVVSTTTDTQSANTSGDNPADLLYSTFLGGSGGDGGSGIAADANGNAYVTGGTNSINFPTTPGAFDTNLNDIFVAKLNQAGSGLDYATFLGGSSIDYVLGIAVDENGSAYVTGKTTSNDFPTTPGAFDTSYNGSGDTYVAKLNPTGSGLTYATFLGGSKRDDGYAIAVDGNGSAYVTGETLGSDFPTTPGAFDTSLNGGADAFVVKLSPAGSGLDYGTLLGGSKDDISYGIAVDESGSAYVMGRTWSSDFPTTPGAFDTSLNGGADVFVVKLSAAGSDLNYATFLGGSSDYDEGKGIAVDENGSAYVTGNAKSFDFPTTLGAFDTSRNGHNDAFVVKLDQEGSRLIYATFLGGWDHDWGHRIAVDGNSSAYVTGSTGSSDFPTTPGAFNTSRNGGPFVVRLNRQGSKLAYATFLGGSNKDIVVDSNGSAYMIGSTRLSDFPTTPGAFDTSYNGNGDVIVIKLSMRTSMHSFRSSTNPIIDGHLSDWPPIEGVMINERAANSIEKNHPSEYDLSASVHSMWTDSTLYFAVSVTDNRITVDSVYIGNDDAFEFGLDGNNDGQPGGIDDHQYTIAADGRKADFGLPDDTFQAIIRQRIDGWDAEIAIPAANLGLSEYSIDQIIGLNMGLIDDDTGGDFDSYLLWQSDRTWQTMPDWGQLHLDGELPPITPTPPAPTPTPTPSGDTVTLQQGFLGYSGAVDTSISQWHPTINNGDSDTLTIRGDGAIGTLLQYDLSTLPDDITVKRATLSLYPKGSSNPQPLDARVYPLLRGWSEAQATWEQASNGNSWQVPGADGIIDRESAAVDHKIIDWLHSWASFDLTGLVQRWIDDSLENNGVVMKQIGGPAVGYDFTSRDVTHWQDTPYRPELIISYWDPTPTATPSPTPTSTPTPTPTPLCLDAYEPDDTWQQAKLILVDGESQQHNFHQPGDVDYVKFGVAAGAQLAMTTSNLATGVDTTLTLYDSDGVTQLAFNDIDPLNPPASRIDWIAPASGTYFLKAAHFNPGTGGCSMTYELAVERTGLTPTPVSLYLPLIVK